MVDIAIMSACQELVNEKVRATMKNSESVVYVDMDGVLADLFNHVAVIHDVEHYNEMTKEDWEVFFQSTDAYHLFRDLPMFKTANELLKMVKTMAGGYKILSSPLNYDLDGSIKGKREWLSKCISVPADEIIFEHEKYKYAVNNGTPNILIDDFRKNITAWNNAGGIGIKYQADENSLEELKVNLEKALE
jgi:5'(3')-deoxyribonucleotidase